MKKGLTLTLCAALVILLAGCSQTVNSDVSSADNSSAENSVTSQTQSQEESKDESSDNKSDDSSGTQTTTGGFRVNGTKLLDANGEEFIMRGINHAHTWYLDEDTTAIKAIAETGSNVVRVVCSDGEQWTKDTEDMFETVINLCIDNEMIAIVEVHDATGKDEISSLNNATDYWIEMKNALIGKEQYVILNIANEWAGSWDSKLWRDGYVDAIPKLREAGIKNTILVDAAGWAQYAKSIGDYGKEVFESDPDRNTMFAVHMYGTAGKNSSVIEKNLKYATDNGLCVIVGEFGYTHTDGEVDEAFIMKYCQDNGIGYLGWSWKGNSGGVEYLDIANNWDGSALSADWGENLINGENGIKQTSKKCSVFTKGE